MSSTSDANDKIATDALTEANELLVDNKYVKEMLRQANKELQSVKPNTFQDNTSGTNASTDWVQVFD